MSHNMRTEEERIAYRKAYVAKREATTRIYKSHLRLMEYRVRQDCGNDYMFEQCTWWCKNHAAIWQENELRMDREKGSPAPKTSDWSGWASVMFVRDNVVQRLFRSNIDPVVYPPDAPNANYDDSVGGFIPELIVVGEHVSKSVRLPVMQFQWRDMLVTTRFNFHDWKVSVQLPECLDATKDLLDIVSTDTGMLHPVYFEGFPKPYIYEPLSSSTYPITAQFSVMFGDTHSMWTFFWLIKRWYDGRFGPIVQTKD